MKKKSDVFVNYAGSIILVTPLRGRSIDWHEGRWIETGAIE